MILPITKHRLGIPDNEKLNDTVGLDPTLTGEDWALQQQVGNSNYQRAVKDYNTQLDSNYQQLSDNVASLSEVGKRGFFEAMNQASADSGSRQRLEDLKSGDPNKFSKYASQFEHIGAYALEMDKEKAAQRDNVATETGHDIGPMQYILALDQQENPSAYKDPMSIQQRVNKLNELYGFKIRYGENGFFVNDVYGVAQDVNPGFLTHFRINPLGTAANLATSIAAGPAASKAVGVVYAPLRKISAKKVGLVGLITGAAGGAAEAEVGLSGLENVFRLAFAPNDDMGYAIRDIINNSTRSATDDLKSATETILWSSLGEGGLGFAAAATGKTIANYLAGKEAVKNALGKSKEAITTQSAEDKFGIKATAKGYLHGLKTPVSTRAKETITEFAEKSLAQVKTDLAKVTGSTIEEAKSVIHNAFGVNAKALNDLDDLTILNIVNLMNDDMARPLIEALNTDVLTLGQRSELKNGLKKFYSTAEQSQREYLNYLQFSGDATRAINNIPVFQKSLRAQINRATENLKAPELKIIIQGKDAHAAAEILGKKSIKSYLDGNIYGDKIAARYDEYTSNGKNRELMRPTQAYMANRILNPKASQPDQVVTDVDDYLRLVTDLKLTNEPEALKLAEKLETQDNFLKLKTQYDNTLAITDTQKYLESAGDSLKRVHNMTSSFADSDIAKSFKNFKSNPDSTQLANLSQAILKSISQGNTEVPDLKLLSETLGVKQQELEYNLIHSLARTRGTIDNNGNFAMLDYKDIANNLRGVEFVTPEGKTTKLLLNNFISNLNTLESNTNKIAMKLNKSANKTSTIATQFKGKVLQTIVKRQWDFAMNMVGRLFSSESVVQLYNAKHFAENFTKFMSSPKDINVLNALNTQLDSAVKAGKISPAQVEEIATEMGQFAGKMNQVDELIDQIKKMPPEKQQEYIDCVITDDGDIVPNWMSPGFDVNTIINK